MNFYDKLLLLDDTDFIELSNNQVGNYVVQITLTNIYRDNIQWYQ